MKIKLLTLNTHSLVEENAADKQQKFVEVALHELPDVIALQEVNQRITASPMPPSSLGGYLPCSPDVTVRADNHALTLAEELRRRGVDYHWSYLPIKRGWGIYDEGVALLFHGAPEAFKILTLSRNDDYENWKTRKALGIQIHGVWFYSLHLGWWDDSDEPFAAQWRRLNAHTKQHGPTFLMGDFNSPSDVRGEGYDLILSDGWIDTHTAATRCEGCVTVPHSIAGWANDALPMGGARMDYIFCNRPYAVSVSRVIFDGKDTPVVSDHFGVICQVQGATADEC